jgi:hypothetical protein
MNLKLKMNSTFFSQMVSWLKKGEPNSKPATTSRIKSLKALNPTMRKFRFEGDPNLYGWKTKPVVGSVYTVKDMNFMRHNFGGWVGITEEDVLKWKDFVEIEKPINMNETNFDRQVMDILHEIEHLLISKNRKYGNSALEPLGVFSKLSAKEGLLVRIDDKLKRIKNGSLEKDDEDVVNDLIGYLVLLKING